MTKDVPPTPDLVDQEPAGDRLDRWVHELVMDKIACRAGCSYWDLLPMVSGRMTCWHGGVMVPNYSANAAAAWAVAEKLRLSGADVRVKSDADGWYVGGPRWGHVSMAATMPLAMCREAILWKLDGKGIPVSVLKDVLE